jgi:DnaJ-class molecular chaperone
MARDRGGFEQGRRRDEQGRPLKLQTPPASESYRENYDRIFRKPCERCSGTGFDFDCGRVVQCPRCSGTGKDP